MRARENERLCKLALVVSWGFFEWCQQNKQHYKHNYHARLDLLNYVLLIKVKHKTNIINTKNPHDTTSASLHNLSFSFALIVFSLTSTYSSRAFLSLSLAFSSISLADISSELQVAVHSQAYWFFKWQVG